MRVYACVRVQHPDAINSRSGQAHDLGPATVYCARACAQVCACGSVCVRVFSKRSTLVSYSPPNLQCAPSQTHDPKNAFPVEIGRFGLALRVETALRPEAEIDHLHFSRQKIASGWVAIAK
jgi:hypothetical protein